MSEIPVGAFNNLQELNLEGNQISMIPDGAFDQLFSLQRLFLGGNKLRRIDSGLFTNIPRPFLLDLYHNSSDNHWDCETMCWLKKEQEDGTIFWTSQFRSNRKCVTGDWSSLDCSAVGEWNFCFACTSFCLLRHCSKTKLPLQLRAARKKNNTLGNFCCFMKVKITLLFWKDYLTWVTVLSTLFILSLSLFWLVVALDVLICFYLSVKSLDIMNLMDWLQHEILFPWKEKKRFTTMKSFFPKAMKTTGAHYMGSHLGDIMQIHFFEYINLTTYFRFRSVFWTRRCEICYQIKGCISLSSWRHSSVQL